MKISSIFCCCLVPYAKKMYINLGKFTEIQTKMHDSSHLLGSFSSESDKTKEIYPQQ